MNLKFSICKYDILIYVCSIYVICIFMYLVILIKKKKNGIFICVYNCKFVFIYI